MALARPLDELSHEQFVRAWSAVAYLFPGLHPDDFDAPDSGWPRVLRRFAVEAWRRAEAGTLSEEELYPGDAAWSGIHDRLHTHEPEEIKRRLSLAFEAGDGFAV
jgi:hypothetical protein